MSNSQIILTVFLGFFAVLCSAIAYNFISSEIRQEARLRSQPSMKRESPKERRARLEAKYK